jgi:hypothetical protein
MHTKTRLQHLGVPHHTYFHTEHHQYAITTLTPTQSRTYTKVHTEDPCTTITNITGTISGNFTPEVCWRITPYVGNTKRATTISLRFADFNLEANRITVYTANNPDSNYQYGVFTGDTNPSGNPPNFAVVKTDALFLYLQGYEETCSFVFEWETGDEVELKTALVVLISVIISLVIPLVSCLYLTEGVESLTWIDMR